MKPADQKSFFAAKRKKMNILATELRDNFNLHDL